jgi:alpha-beta hydrolase superfamily lysophospholipase
MSRGTVLIVHGLGEHCGRYEEVAERIHRWQWNVLSFDLRGHGRSEGRRGGLQRPDDLLVDLASVVDIARRSSTGPLILLGHSLGGLIAARFVAELLASAPAAWSRPLEGLVLSSPALDPGLNLGQKLMLALVGRALPNLAVNNGLRPQWLSRDPQVVRDYIDDPLVHDRVTGRLARFIVDSGQHVLDRASAWRLPTLLVYSGRDRCVSPAGSVAFAKAAPPIVSCHAFPQLAHEVFFEPEKEQLFALLEAWLVGREPTGAARDAQAMRAIGRVASS